MKLSPNGDLTIPAEIGRRAGFEPDVEVEIVVEKGALRIIQAREDLSAQRLRAALKDLEPLPPPLRSTDEIMALTRGED